MLRNKYVHGVPYDPCDAQRVYVAEAGNSLYCSDDGGRSFVPMGAGLPESGPADWLSIHPVNPEVLFYGGDVGERCGRFFVSTDAVRSW